MVEEMWGICPLVEKIYHQHYFLINKKLKEKKNSENYVINGCLISKHVSKDRTDCHGAQVAVAIRDLRLIE
jgi:hypothetical protein